MNFSFDDLVSVNQILADVLLDVDDEETRLRTRGWYTRQVGNALKELSFETYFDTRIEDIDIPENCIIKIPKGAFNIRNISVYSESGTNILDSRNVYIKMGFNTRGYNTGYTAKNKPYQYDPFVNPYHPSGIPNMVASFEQPTDYPTRNSQEIYYCNIRNGYIYLSNSCRNYTKLRIEYNGMGVDINDVGIVPPICREEVIMYVVERTFRSLKARDYNKYAPLHRDIYSQLYMPIKASKWSDAVYRLKRLDTKTRSDLREYFARLMY
jgi:hypothetical protein